MRIPLTSGLMFGATIGILILGIGWMIVLSFQLSQASKKGKKWRWDLVPLYLALFITWRLTMHNTKLLSADRVVSTESRVVFGVIFIGLLGGTLFFVKVRWLRIYALLELVFAGFVAGQTMYQLGDEISPVQSLTLFAGAYLVIRGLDNFKKDLDARRKIG